MNKIEIKKADVEDVSHIVNIFNLARAKMKYLPIIHTQKQVNDFFTSLVEDQNTLIVK